ncbi:MAG: ATP-binding cassette domain-containing protein, partial [Thermodesulfovibrionales bacterium]|nr:ATP-binding cassette domain-containing protein [Thermodesulfovibrionales bacterium]
MENVARAQIKSKDIRLSVQINSFKYPDGTQALSDIVVNISHGEFIGILGANGSGKTTLLKIMDGLMKDFEGSAYLDG